jgi:hypothetical protein
MEMGIDDVHGMLSCRELPPRPADSTILRLGLFPVNAPCPACMA